MLLHLVFVKLRLIFSIAFQIRRRSWKRGHATSLSRDVQICLTWPFVAMELLIKGPICYWRYVLARVWHASYELFVAYITPLLHSLALERCENFSCVFPGFAEANCSWLLWSSKTYWLIPQVLVLFHLRMLQLFSLDTHTHTLTHTRVRARINKWYIYLKNHKCRFFCVLRLNKTALFFLVEVLWEEGTNRHSWKRFCYVTAKDWKRYSQKTDNNVIDAIVEVILS